MAQDLLNEPSSQQNHVLIPARRRQLLHVAQELKDRLRFSQLYEEQHKHDALPQQHGQPSIQHSSAVAQELSDRLNFRQASRVRVRRGTQLHTPVFCFSCLTQICTATDSCMH